MVNVKSYSCFPTMVYEFDGGLSKQNHANMLNILDFENPDNNLHAHLAFTSFAKTVKECTKEILHINQYFFEDIEITNMWGNLLSEKESHPPHTHSNNLWSGVYYISAGEDASPICFFDPRPSANYLQPKNNPNWNNSSMLKFPAHVGTGLIFPSWLMHWVPPTPSERMSVSWNILLRGDYGMGQFQNASI